MTTQMIKISPSVEQLIPITYELISQTGTSASQVERKTTPIVKSLQTEAWVNAQVEISMALYGRKAGAKRMVLHQELGSRLLSQQTWGSSFTTPGDPILPSACGTTSPLALRDGAALCSITREQGHHHEVLSTPENTHQPRE